MSGARVVKVANTLPPALLGADPRVADGRLRQFPGGPLPALGLVKLS